MYKVNDYIIYKRETCKINSIQNKLFNNTDYYLLTPVSDPSLTIKLPVTSPYIEASLSLQEVNEIISHIKDIPPINVQDNLLENTYKELLNTEDYLDLIKIIKTTYLRNQDRLANGKKIGDKDDTYFKKAEKYLYNSLKIPLNMTYEECKDYVVKTVSKEVGVS